MAFARKLDRAGEYILPPQVVPFPRGFAFGPDGTLFLASGIGPAGEGDNAILAFDSDRRMLPSWKVRDPELSPLDVAIAPSGNIVVSSEHPFGAADAVATIREYDRADGHLVRVLLPRNDLGFQKPRGVRFGPQGRLLYCVTQDKVVAFDFATEKCLGAVCQATRPQRPSRNFLSARCESAARRNAVKPDRTGSRVPAAGGSGRYRSRRAAAR
jgi:hypothetical protein